MHSRPPKRPCAWLLALAALLPCLQAAAAEGATRTFRIQDLFELHSLPTAYGGPFATSPDGESIAFAVNRPARELRDYKLDFLPHSDVFVHAGKGESVNLTLGAEDDSSWWAPQWSPDGKRLAMLSTRGGNVRVWLREADGSFRALTDRAVDIAYTITRPFLWLDDDRLLIPVMGQGERPRVMVAEIETPEIATRMWPKTRRGQEVAASILDSGVPPGPHDLPQGELRVVNLATGETRVLADAATAFHLVSPDARYVAFVRQVGLYTPRAGERLPFTRSEMYELGLARTDPVSLRTRAGGEPLRGESTRNLIPGSMRWSPDGRWLAFLAYPGEGRSEPPRLLRLERASGEVTRVDLGGLDAAAIVRRTEQMEWLADGSLLLMAAMGERGESAPVDARRDWWRVGAGAPANLTAAMTAVPDTLWPSPDRTALVGRADGALWRIEAATGRATDLTAALRGRVERLQWPTESATGFPWDQLPVPGAAYSTIVFSVRDGAGQEHYAVDTTTGRLTRLQSPAPGARLNAYDPSSRVAIYHRDDDAGLFAWRVGAGGDAGELLATNLFLRQIRPAQTRVIEYTSLNGRRLKAGVLLPPDYVPGRRYPLLTHVYAGKMLGAAAPWGNSLNNDSPFNMQIAAAHGYAVLLPSMPLSPEGHADEPMLRLTDGVLPAVDRAIELGIADPDRLYVMGFSFGGFSVYGLVAQTHRFHAAVSGGGPSSLISLYSSFDARDRYGDQAHRSLFRMGLSEAAQTRMGAPPWQDLGRYLRNSPIFQVGRIETPLLIHYGDMDHVAIQQGEEMFNSLYRQGKRARFLRYWGEGHGLQSPANIVHFWEQVFAWFEAHRGP